MCTVSAECFPRGEKCHFFNECFLFFLFFFFFLFLFFFFFAVQISPGSAERGGDVRGKALWQRETGRVSREDGEWL